MNLLTVFFALVSFAPSHDLTGRFAPSNQLTNTPTGIRSSMVSEDYAEISWNTVPAAEAYEIQIRKANNGSTVALAAKTVWTSFYFRLAEPNAGYEFRLIAVTEGRQNAWTDWTPLNTAQILTSGK
jgi:hypothetical protein